MKRDLSIGEEGDETLAEKTAIHVQLCLKVVSVEERETVSNKILIYASYV
jgi:hypothetical protein